MSVPLYVAAFLNRLHAPKGGVEGGWTDLCPAHDDQRASLSIGLGRDGRILIHCHAGCAVEAILARLGISASSLFPPREERAQRAPSRHTATYAYRDERGQLLFEVLRYEPKTFRQRRPDGNGGWSWRLDGVRRVLYRLPEILEAVRAGRTIFVVEGEKDADNLVKLGVDATTNAGGANKAWDQELAAPLRGARVVVIPDADPPGRKHAQQIAQVLGAIALEVRVLELDRKDASDWIASGGQLEQLERLAAEAPLATPAPELPPDVEREPVITSMSDVAPQAVQWLWRPYLPAGKLALLEGDPGAGKTWLALQITAILTRGWPLPNAEPRPPVTVLYLTAEDGLADTLRPRLDTVKADVSRVKILEGHRTVRRGRVTTQPFSLADLDVLRRALAREKPALLVIDPLQGFLGAQVDMHRANEVRPILSGLMRATEEHGCAVLGIRHLAKGLASKVMYRGLGSIDFTAAARSVLLAGQSPSSQERAIVHVKSSLAAKGPTIGYEVTPDGFTWRHSSLTATDLNAPEGEDADGVEEARDFLLQALAQGQRAAKEVQIEARQLGISDRALRVARTSIGVKTSRVNASGTARGTGFWLWSLAPQADTDGLARARVGTDPYALNALNEPEEH